MFKCETLMTLYYKINYSKNLNKYYTTNIYENKNFKINWYNIDYTSEYTHYLVPNIILFFRQNQLTPVEIVEKKFFKDISL